MSHIEGCSQLVPPGFRFHPTEEELLQYYLRKKLSLRKIVLDIIPDVDLNKLEPWDIQEKCKIGSYSTPQNEWYFFSHKDKKYPTGTRTNRATAAGFWKATGRDKVIYSNSQPIGRRKTLVFYKGRAPHGQKSDWIMHEYRLGVDDDNSPIATPNNHSVMSNANGSQVTTTQEEGWVVCRVFKKKNRYKTVDNNPMTNAAASISEVTNDHRSMNSCDEEGTLEQILHYEGRSRYGDELGMLIDGDIDGAKICSFLDHQDRFIQQLPSLESPDYASSCSRSFNHHHQEDNNDKVDMSSMTKTSTGRQDWAALDRIAVSHFFTGESQTNCNVDINDDDNHLLRKQTTSSSPQDYVGRSGECDLWSCFMQSSSLSSNNLPNTPRF